LPAVDALAPHLIRLALAALIVFLLVNQCRRPRWFVGRFVAHVMNQSHSGLTDWGLSHVSIGPQFSILDVGCGGGRTVQKLAAAAPTGRICGVDYSAASVAAARATNAERIAAGHVEIVHGSVSQLPFADAAFDLVTAVESHYYWPSLVDDLREIGRVLKPGGRALIIAEVYRRTGVASALVGRFMRLLGGTLLTADQYRAALNAAGFVDVAIDEERRKGWISMCGQSPAVPTRI